MGLIEGGNKRIAQNTLLLYFRMLFMMVISLYTSRVILQVLGVEDYGIYSVVGGLVSMFSLISNSLSNCIGRFIAFEIGRNDVAGNGVFGDIKSNAPAVSVPVADNRENLLALDI